MKSPILGSTYVTRSTNAANSRMVNLFPEIVQEGGKEPGYLNKTPGLKLITSLGNGPIRGLWTFGDYFYVVSGQEVYRLDRAYNARLIGTILSKAGPISMCDNGIQLFLACNPNIYVYNSNTEAFTQVQSEDFVGAVTVAYLDSYFVFNEPNSQKVWISDSFNGTSIDPLEFASAEGSPDILVGIARLNQEIWLFGSISKEVWYDAATVDFPLQKISGAFDEIGCLSPYSIVKLDNSLFWLGCDVHGVGIVYRSNGYTGKRISTHAIEWQIQQYVSLSDSYAYAYQQDGHMFYVLVFPSADTTWVYDLSTQAWHERASLKDGQFVRHRASCHVSYNNKNIVGDYENGNLYYFDMDTYDDAGLPQPWLRSWRALPTGKNSLNRTSHYALQLDCETGVGLSSGQGSNPIVRLRWSDDGGHTWSNYHETSMGNIGDYGKRVIWRRLGTTLKGRDRVYEVSGSDPVKIRIMGAKLDIVEAANG